MREATLAPLRRLKGDEAEPYFVAALARSDYQLLRTAAIELKGAKPTPQLAAGLLDALRRVTAERKETSRDTRLALLERLQELGSPDQAGRTRPAPSRLRYSRRAACRGGRFSSGRESCRRSIRSSLPRPAVAVDDRSAKRARARKDEERQGLFHQLRAERRR